jgi:superfamily II DNA/RNA helicase
MFTATWPTEVKAMADEFLHRPVHISIGRTEVLNAAQSVTQTIIVMADADGTNKYKSDVFTGGCGVRAYTV